MSEQRKIIPVAEEKNSAAPGPTDRLRAYLSGHAGLIFACFAVGFLCCVWAGSQADKALPPTEGWYSYYAYEINERGAVPYLDFELLFPPLYVYVIAFVTKIFGYRLMVLRVFGVLIYIATGVFACLIFEKLFRKPLVGMIGGMLTAAFLQSESAQIFYDYIRLMDLSVYASIYFFLRYFDGVFRPGSSVEKRDGPFSSDGILGTVFAVHASLYKQSSGLLYLAFCLAALVFAAAVFGQKRELWRQVLVSFAVCFFLYGGMFLFMASKGALGAYFYYNFQASVGAKGGSLSAVLFGWFFREKKLLFACLPVALLWVGLLFAAAVYSRRKRAERGVKDADGANGADVDDKAEQRLMYATAAAALLTVVLCFAIPALAEIFSSWNRSWRKYLPFLFSMLAFPAFAGACIFRRKIRADDGFLCKYFYLSGTAFVLAYAVSMSGGLGESQVAPAFALTAVSFAGIARFPRRRFLSLATAVFMVFDLGISFSVKIRSPYSWWGLDTGSYGEQTTECVIPAFQGIEMNEAYARMYNNVYREIRENSAAEEEIFIFPHMPVLYLATERRRATFTAVQWFDVSTDQAVAEDIEVLKEKRPVVLVLCFIPDSVREAHEQSFREGQKSGLTKMQEFLCRFVEEENYILLSSDTVSAEYTIEVYRLPESGE